MNYMWHSKSELKIVLVQTWKKIANTLLFKIEFFVQLLAWAFSPNVEYIHEFSGGKHLYKYGQEKKHYVNMP